MRQTAWEKREEARKKKEARKNGGLLSEDTRDIVLCVLVGDALFN